MRQFNQFFQLKFFQQCVSYLYWLPSLSWWPQSLLSLALSRLLSHRLTARVQWGIRAIQRVSQHPKGHIRYYVAALMVLGLAIFSRWVYLWFDPSEGGPNAYWNWYYYLHSVGKDLTIIFTSSAAFILIKHNVRWMFLPVVSVSFITVASGWTVSSNQEYHALPMATFILACVMVSLAWLGLLDFLIWLYNHRELAKVSRIQGVARLGMMEAMEAGHAFSQIDKEATDLKSLI